MDQKRKTNSKLKMTHKNGDSTKNEGYLKTKMTSKLKMTQK